MKLSVRFTKRHSQGQLCTTASCIASQLPKCLQLTRRLNLSHYTIASQIKGNKCARANYHSQKGKFLFQREVSFAYKFYMSRGFIKGQAPGKLTGCERDLAINFPSCFRLLLLLSFIRKTKNARL